MRSRRRRNGNFRLVSNPFVVFADISIALSFIFAVQGLATIAGSSEAVVLAKRQLRQNKLQDEISASLARSFKGSTITMVRSPGDESTHLKIRSKSKTNLAEVWTNGNFLRIMVYSPVFKPKNGQISDSARSLYRLVGTVVKHHANELAYLFVHGVVEPQEAMDQQAAVELSRFRADNVMDLLREEGVVGPPAKPDKASDSWGHPMVPAKYAISYGTGKDLYTSNLPVGRVDLVLFYQDNSNGSRSR